VLLAIIAGTALLPGDLRSSARPKKRRVSTHPVKKRTHESKAIIAKLDMICLALPNTTNVLAWGEPTWRVRGKIFAQFDDHHHGAEHISVWLPPPDGAQPQLIEADPERFFRPTLAIAAGSRSSSIPIRTGAWSRHSSRRRTS
jgi:hypothetical protein